ncbi:thioredoxin-disulfide reductase [Halarsenatibacter silvermanii]|uniref:Thioredoxin reductase n=1 Tax=Halarsenatibacter silvermanii TaxID=321763 RepID=A0A1G9R1B7_9FIRM|nr:thioredoxin-disulfide reductase [Halarsenatibacter silvermanii]SDM16245.1 thioredoxin reductase (NADPH) [Halarsenatibacter silvermanii]
MGNADRKTHDLIIIGGGPAGLTASIYAGRAGLKPVTINGPNPGGQIMNTDVLENFPGFPDGIKGPELGQKLVEQAQNQQVELLFEEVKSIDLESRPFSVVTHMQELQSRTMIIATGAHPRRLGLQNEGRLTGDGVSYCAVCDGALYDDETVAVVGGGDSALEEADYLTRFADKVYLIHRRDEYRAGPTAVELIESNDSIKPVLSAEITELMIDEGLDGLVLEDKKKEEEFELPEVTGLFISIGYEPNTDLVCSQLECDDWGYIITDEFMKTSREGVFAAGDVQDHHYQQVITAAASGAKAAMEANSYLRQLKR